MDVSENNGTPKSSILIGFSIINHPFWGTPIFGNTHIDKEIVYTINGTCIKNQGLLETFGQFASPQKATSFLGNVPGWNVAPWSLQRHLKWSNSSRYTKNGQRLRKFLAPKMTWIQVGEIWSSIWFHGFSICYSIYLDTWSKSRKNNCFRHIGPSWYFK